MPQEPETSNVPTIHPETIRKIQRILIKWGRKNYKHYPWREPKEPWHGLIAEILLQRTRADSVVPVYDKFLGQFPSPEELGKASIQKIEKIIYPLGLRWRAPLLKQLGKQLAAMGGQIPSNLDELLNLPGVGPYTSSAWLGFHGGKRSVIVDANVVRFICRLTGLPMNGETRRQKWLIKIADNLTPEKTWKQYNYAILDFTMQICVKSPKCNECPIDETICAFRKNRTKKDKL